MDMKATLTHALTHAMSDAMGAGVSKAMAGRYTPSDGGRWITANMDSYLKPLLSQLAPPPVQVQADLWHYDAGARIIADQNGLAVARDVGPDDARVILSMQRGLLRIASPYEGSDKGSDRAGAFNECAAVARSALDGNEAGNFLED